MSDFRIAGEQPDDQAAIVNLLDAAMAVVELAMYESHSEEMEAALADLSNATGKVSFQRCDAG